MITLGGITLSDNMFLKGVYTAKKLLVQQDRSLNGGSFLTYQKIRGGETYTLGSTTAGGSVMGIWCTTIIDQVQALMEAGNMVPLDYRGDLYNVLIIEMSKMDPLFHFEVEGPGKKYIGSITITTEG